MKASRFRFRAWDKDDNRMYTTMIAGHSLDDGDVFVGEVGYFNGVLMQSTGLCDKNGVEIFEGDVLAFGDRVGDVDIEGGCGEVKWGKCEWYVSGFHYECQDLPWDAFGEGAALEVIGNVYENPELLEEQE